MGNCLISIHVTGSHHNGLESDIDQMAGKLVDELRAKGHYVSIASVVAGSDYSILEPYGRWPLKGKEVISNPPWSGGEIVGGTGKRA